MEDIDKVRDELYNYNDNVQGTDTKGDIIRVFLMAPDLQFPKEYKGYTVVTIVSEGFSLHNTELVKNS